MKINVCYCFTIRMLFCIAFVSLLVERVRCLEFMGGDYERSAFDNIQKMDNAMFSYVALWHFVSQMYVRN